MSSFSQIIHKFTDSSDVGFYMIHLERAKERLSDVAALEKGLNMSLQIFPGVEGAQVVADGHPTLCITKTGGHRGAGDIGCTVSHIRICKEALEKGYSHVVIFEDDCQLTGSLSTIDNVLTHAKDILRNGWDLFILDGNLHTSSSLTSQIIQVKGFYQTHAVILSRFFMKKLVQLYETYYAEGYTYAIDGIYTNLLHSGGCTGYGIAHQRSLFKQKAGYSYIIDGFRES